MYNISEDLTWIHCNNNTSIETYFGESDQTDQWLFTFNITLQLLSIFSPQATWNVLTTKQNTAISARKRQQSRKQFTTKTYLESTKRNWTFFRSSPFTCTVWTGSRLTIFPMTSLRKEHVSIQFEIKNQNSF